MQSSNRLDKPLNLNGYVKNCSCIICDSTDLIPFLSFGDMPLAGGFLLKSDLESDQSYPMTIVFCRSCYEVQIQEIVPPSLLFTDYRYTSSTTKTLRDHFKAYAAEMFERFLTPTSFVVEFGSNDGVLLLPFRDLGIAALGVEPAVNIANIAKEKGCIVVNEFFNSGVADQIKTKFGSADLILANNIFAHISDMHEPMRAIRALIKPDGAFVFEVHYLLDLINTYQYDMFYHEHLLHHSVGALTKFLNMHGMEIFDVKRVPTHCGSIRVYSQIKGSGIRPITNNVKKLLFLEEEHGLYKESTFVKFGLDVLTKRNELIHLVRKLKLDGKRIAAYGASGRATIQLNFCNFTDDEIEYVVDASQERIGRYIPGVHIPIVASDILDTNPPDYLIVFAYNYMDEILNKEVAYIAQGGKFIIPLPHPKII